jgi:peptide/nickel transport system substrate-binding protein
MTCEQLGGWSDTGYCNEDYDALYDEQGRTVDTEERAAIVDEMQRIVFDDSPYIVLYYVNAIDAHSTAWDGLLMSPQGSINSLSKLSLEQVHQSG